MEIGGIDYNSVVGNELFEVPAYSDNYWASVANGMYYDDIMIDVIKANPTDTDLRNDNFKKAIFDTGTTLMGIPGGVFTKLQKKF